MNEQVIRFSIRDGVMSSYDPSAFGRETRWNHPDDNHLDDVWLFIRVASASLHVPAAVVMSWILTAAIYDDDYSFARVRQCWNAWNEMGASTLCDLWDFETKGGEL